MTRYRSTPDARPLTYEQALQRLTALCSRSEYSSAEVREKARLWQLPVGDTDRLVDFLIDERYIDDARYCRAYAKDKLRYNHWGRVKIGQMLRAQGLDDRDIREGLEEIDEEEYRKILADVVRAKDRTLSEADPYIRQQKILRHAVSKGFEMHLVLDSGLLEQTGE